MDAILDILNELKPGIDYRTRHDLVDTRELDSLTIITLVSELEDAFDITIPAVESCPLTSTPSRACGTWCSACAKLAFSEVPGLS